jgi:uncharacterized repeat protein (TIGR01451 family)
MWRPLLLTAALTLSLGGCAPRPPSFRNSPLTGKDGAKTISGTEIVNRYTPLAVAANAGDSTLAVADATGFAAGDLILLVAAQGASIDTTDSTSYGTLSALGSAGAHELWVLSAVSGSSLTLDLGCTPGGLQNSYPLLSKPQVVRVPQYSSLTVPAGAVLTGAPWNGSTGGFIAVHVEATANVAGAIDASGLGFRGGAVSLGSTTITNDVMKFCDSMPTGGEKGEGIAGDQTAYDGACGRYGRGAPANGGGGGDGYLGGGGGGAGVAGSSAIAYSGQGTMSNMVTGSSAWTLDPGVGSAGGPGGGRGGYTLSGLDQNALTVGPGVAAWAGNGRNERGGLGGHPLTAASRLFLGGGGGAGSFDGGGVLPASTAGARGGGVVFVIAQALTGAGFIRADGASGRDGAIVGTNDVSSIANGGGAGGGGGGGMVILRTTGSPSIAVSARGGAGGNLAVTGMFATGIEAASGPGGGGAGGGVLLGSGLSLASPPTVSGGAGGTTDSAALTEFPVNGATSGDDGTTISGVAQSAAPVACLPADLSITLADSADPVDTGTAYTYTATINNIGPNAAYDLTATISLPSGVALGMITAPGWSCGVASLTVTCTRALQLSGGASTILIAVTAPSMPAALNATATIASREDSVAGNNSASQGTTVQYPRADLDLSVTGPAATAAGEQFTYTLAVHNNGPRTAPSVQVADTLPAGVTFISGGGGGWTCMPSGGTVTCSQGSLVAGGSSSVDLVVSAPALTSPSAATNSATVSISSSGTVDPVAGNDTDGVSTTITPVDLSITKTDLLDPVTASGAITYTITVTNPAAVAAHGVTVSDPLPAGTKFVNASGSGWICNFAAGTMSCTRPTIAAAPTATPPITLVVTAPSTQGVISNTATVSATATDPSLANNTATQQTTISPPAPGSADLSIAIADAPDPVDIGAPLVYTLSVTNAGPDPADGVRVISSLPPGAVFVSATGAGWSCMQGSSTVTCTHAAALATGSATPIVLSLSAPGTPGTTTASAVVTASTPDPAVGNDAAIENTTVIDPTVLNQAPMISVPPLLSSLEDTPLVLSDADAPVIADADAGPAEVELHVVAEHCVLSLPRTDGLTLLLGDGVLDPELRARGMIDDLNSALNGATLTPARGFFGTAVLEITVDDLGHSGAGGAMQGSASLSVSVIAVDHPPQAIDDEATIPIDAGPTRIDVLANDSSGDPEQIARVVSTTTPAHGLAAPSASGDAVIYTPTGTYVGDDRFSYTITDGNTQASANVTVHVIAPPAPSASVAGGGYGCSTAGSGRNDTALLVLILLASLAAPRLRVRRR